MGEAEGSARHPAGRGILERRLPDRAREVAPRGRGLARRAPLALQATKPPPRQLREVGFRARVSALGAVPSELAEAEDAREGVASFVERRDPVFDGR